MATQVEGTGSAPGAIEELQRLIERFGLIAAGLVALAGSLATFWTDTLPEVRWGVAALAAGALLFVAVGKVVMPAIEARRRRKVIAIPEGSLRGPTSFRLRPYEEADHADFDRPDNVHHEALRWLERSSEPFLDLTGFSGTGKSSLLQAWLAPELAADEPPTRTVVARSYADPIDQLADALTRPGVVWDKRPSSTDDPRALLQRAAERVRPGRLLIAIDQFEECLILQDAAGRARLADLFRSLRNAPVPGLTFLLMLRDDYLDFDALRALGLPEVRSDGNWFKLNALSRGDARQLLDERLRIARRCARRCWMRRARSTTCRDWCGRSRSTCWAWCCSAFAVAP